MSGSDLEPRWLLNRYIAYQIIIKIPIPRNPYIQGPEKGTGSRGWGDFRGEKRPSHGKEIFVVAEGKCCKSKRRRIFETTGEKGILLFEEVLRKNFSPNVQYFQRPRPCPSLCSAA